MSALDTQKKWNAVVTNDRRCDGAFFYGVCSTGIFCRPSCPSKPPKRENVVFFDSAEEAQAAGFRPCLRCRPELAAFDPAAELAEAAKAVIDQSFADRAALRAGLDALGVTRRHLTALFEARYGMAVEQYTAQVRLRRARELLDAGRPVTDTAFAVGLESSAAFSVFFKKQEGVSPSDYIAQRALEHPRCLCDTPLGVLRITEDQRGIVALKFADGADAAPQSGPKGLYLADAEKQLLEYFVGKRRVFDLPLSPSGTPFQERVWKALQTIPYGETRCYQQLAGMIGNEKASRAVGMANNRNPILILIPCHRVVGKDGKLVGYAAGIQRKQHLLDLEARAGQ